MAGPLLLLLLARAPPAAAGDGRKSGEPERTRGRHGGGAGGGGRGRDCDSPRGVCALTRRGLRAQGPAPAGDNPSEHPVWEQSGAKDASAPSAVPRAEFGPTGPS